MSWPYTAKLPATAKECQEFSAYLYGMARRQHKQGRYDRAANSQRHAEGWSAYGRRLMKLEVPWVT